MISFNFSLFLDSSETSTLSLKIQLTSSSLRYFFILELSFSSSELSKNISVLNNILFFKKSNEFLFNPLLILKPIVSSNSFML